MARASFNILIPISSIPSVSGTTNYIPEFNGPNSIGNSSLFEIGATIFGGTNLGIRPFSNTKFVITSVISGTAESQNIGIFSEAQGTSTGDSAGIYGHGWTYPGLVAGGLSSGITGKGKVTNSTDISSAIGVSGYSNDTHSGGFNVGLYGNASGSGTGNYALFMAAGNIYSSASQTWRLATSTTALNIASNLMIFDTTNTRVGVGVSPVAPFHVLGTSTTFASTTTASSGIFRVEGTATNKLFIGSFSDSPFGMYMQTNSTTYPLVLQPAGGNVGVGIIPTQKLHISGALIIAGSATLGAAATAGMISFETPVTRYYVGDGSGYTWALSKRSGSVTTDMFVIKDSNGFVGINNNNPSVNVHIGSNSSGQQILRLNTAGGSNQSPVYSLFRAGVAESVMWVGASPSAQIQFAINPASYTDAALTAATKFSISTVSIDISSSGYGVKLPSTPANSDIQTLDAYNENTRAVTTGTSGWTYVTCNQYWTLVGRKVTLHTIFTGGTSSATAGATIPTPTGLTPIRIAAGTAVNSAGTALGNAVCVATTSGTILTSNTITSSAVDKVLSVTYEIL